MGNMVFGEVPMGQLFTRGEHMRHEPAANREVFILVDSKYFDNEGAPAEETILCRLIRPKRRDELWAALYQWLTFKFAREAPVQFVPLELFLPSPPSVVIIGPNGKPRGVFPYDMKPGSSNVSVRTAVEEDA